VTGRFSNIIRYLFIAVLLPIFAFLLEVAGTLIARLGSLVLSSLRQHR